MLTLIKMKWIVMLFLLLYTAGSYLHCAVLYGDILAQKYTIVLDFKDTPVEAVLDAITKQTGIKVAYNNEVLDRKKPVTVKIETSDILEALYAVLGDSYICRQIDDYIAISKRPKPVSGKIAGKLPTMAEEKASVIVSGLITDGDGNPLIGVNILVKGKSTGVVSDLYGRLFCSQYTPSAFIKQRFSSHSGHAIDRADPRPPAANDNPLLPPQFPFPFSI